LSGYAQRQYRHRRRAEWWFDVGADLKLALRSLKQRPGFAIALALTLGIGLGANLVTFDVADRLLFRSPEHLGFDRSRVVIASVDLRLLDYEPQRMRAFYEQALERIGRINGVETAAIGSTVPMESSIATEFRAEGRDSVPVAKTGGPYFVSVTPAYFRTMGTRIVQGRGYTEADRKGTQPVVVLGESMARRIWPDESALGRCVYIGGGDDEPPCATVVGIAQDVRSQGINRDEVMQYYIPLAQEQTVNGMFTLFVRAKDEPDRLIAPIAREIHSMQSNLPYVNVRPLQTVVEPDLEAWRLGAILFTVFGMIALLLAAVGLYSMLSWMVASRTREMGLRMALGASPLQVVKLVMNDGLKVAIVGVLAGIGIAVGTSAVHRADAFRHVAARAAVIRNRRCGPHHGCRTRRADTRASRNQRRARGHTQGRPGSSVRNIIARAGQRVAWAPARFLRGAGMGAGRLRLILAGILVVFTALWFLSLPETAFSGEFWQVRRILVTGTGMIAIGLMSIAIILAARPVQIESVLGGLDRFYRLHKWLGVTAALFAIAHWAIEAVPRSLARSGIIEPPARVPPPPATQATTNGFGPLRNLHDLAADLGGIAFILLLILVAIALWKRFPYRQFLITHRVMAPVYLVLVFHAVVLMDPAYWGSPVGLLLVLLMTGGSIAALISLFHRIGKSRRAVGTIRSLRYYDDNQVLDVSVQLSTAWPGHHAGQFAFVDFGGSEGAHPFTITSTWPNNGRIEFSIKGIGDYTKELPRRLFEGQQVTIEGPYGRFDFRGEGQRQIWIGSGSGITPFIAGLNALRGDGRRPPHPPIDLIYATRSPSEPFIENIRELAEKAGVRLHLMIEQRDGLLTPDRLEAMIPEWREADIWFCGPRRFGDTMRSTTVARGLPATRFHQEMFEMR